MVNTETFERGIRAMLVLIGFFAGLLMMAGLYGLIFPEQLVEQSLSTVPAARFASAAILVVGIAGIYLSRLVRRRYLAR